MFTSEDGILAKSETEISIYLPPTPLHGRANQVFLTLVDKPEMPMI
jgi:hypothetical protein